MTTLRCARCKRPLSTATVIHASLCYRCHSELDQGSFLTRAERETMHEEARIKTQRELIRRDMWPASVPTPEEVTA